MEQLDAERKASTRRAVRVHAATSDGRRRCLLTFDSASEKFEDLRTRLASELSLDTDFVCTYSTSPGFLKSPTKCPYRQQELSSDLELSCAVLTATDTEDGALFIKTHRQWSGSLSGLTRHRNLQSRGTFQADWDLLEETKDVVRLWQQLPSVAEVPFARILRAEQRRSLGQLARTFHGLQNRLPLQEFEWAHFLDRQRRLVREADLRLRVYHGGIQPSLRPIVWRHLLYVFPPMMTGDERHEFLAYQREEYRRLRSAWQNIQEYSSETSLLLTCVRNDVARTDRVLPFFAGDDNPHLDALFNVLVTFALNCPEISYLQGLNDIAAIFLMIYNGMEADTYIIFHSFMRVARSLYTPDGLALKFAHLKALLHRFDAPFFDYLAGCNSHDLLFCYRWLLLEMKREFSLSDAMRVMEVMWSTISPPAEYTAHLQEVMSSGFGSMHSSFGAMSIVSQSDNQWQDGGDEGAIQSGFVSSPGEEVAEIDLSDTWTIIDYIPPAVPEHSAAIATSRVDTSLVEVGQAAVRSAHASESSPPNASFDKLERSKSLPSALTVRAASYKEQLSTCSDDPIFGGKSSPVDEQSSSRHLLAFPTNSPVTGSWENISSEEPFGQPALEEVKQARGSLDRSYDQVSNSSVHPHARAQVAEDERLVRCRSFTNGSVSSSLQSFMLSGSPSMADNALDTEESVLAEEAEEDECVEDVIQATYGSPFVLFVCLAILLLHRDHIMEHRLAEEEIAIYFDKLRLHYNTSRILEKARSLLETFVSSEL